MAPGHPAGLRDRTRGSCPGRAEAARRRSGFGRKL